MYYVIIKHEKVKLYFKEKIDRINQLFLFVIEFIFWLLNIFIFLNIASKYTYESIIPVVLSISFVVLLSLFINYFVFLFIRFREDIPSLFVICMIPIGLSMMFLVLPDFIPDEQTHFQKAYAISCFDFSSLISVNVDIDYRPMKHLDYSQILSDINLASFNNEVVTFNEACSYDAILYFLPAMSMFIGRTIGLSLYGCYYLGRMTNLIISIIFAYHTLKITPKAKWIFFILYFNPMMIHLSGSFSSDALINSVCFYSIGYFLYLFYKDEPISNKDIAIVISCIMFIFVAKYVYLSLFGVYFLVFKKVLKISKKQWVLLFCCVVIWALYYCVMKYFVYDNLESILSHQMYLEENNVDSKKQIQFLMSNPLNLIYMYSNTLIEKMPGYVGTFVSRLGWLEIKINPISFFLFYGLVFFSAFLEDIKFKFSIRAWIMFVFISTCLLVILGLYLYWTPVGTFVTQGVQGRYFISCIILFLLAISNEKFSEIKNIHYIYPMFAVMLNVLVLKDIFMYFI